MTRRSADFEVVHDLRQPLATIAALAAAAKLADGVPAATQRCLDQITEQVLEMGSLCRRLLQPRTEPRAFAADVLAGSVVKGASVAYGRTIGLCAQPATVVADVVDVRRALWNLLENACRASVGAPVRLSVAREGGEVRFEVGDGGPGFGAAPPGSTSLGLDIVQGVAERNGGRVEVRLSDLGGASVAVVLPAAPAGGLDLVEGEAWRAS